MKNKLFTGVVTIGLALLTTSCATTVYEGKRAIIKDFYGKYNCQIQGPGRVPHGPADEAVIFSIKKISLNEVYSVKAGEQRTEVKIPVRVVYSVDPKDACYILKNFPSSYNSTDGDKEEGSVILLAGWVKQYIDTALEQALVNVDPLAISSKMPSVTATLKEQLKSSLKAENLADKVNIGLITIGSPELPESITKAQTEIINSASKSSAADSEAAGIQKISQKLTPLYIQYMEKKALTECARRPGCSIQFPNNIFSAGK